MSPELGQRLATLTKNQRAELAAVIERLQDKGIAGDLDEADLHQLLDALTAPVPPRPPDVDELLMVMTFSERQAIRRLGKRITERDLIRIAPFLADEAETMRKVERLRALPDGGWYAKLLEFEEERALYAQWPPTNRADRP